VIIESAKKRAEPLEHLLLYGNSGLGKTSLAQVIAHEMGAPITHCSGTSLERVGDVASLLTNLQDGEILFVDECHRLPRATLETLYSAMEDYTLHLVLGKGPMARTMDLKLPKFTLVGATTKMAQLPAPFRNRFGAIFQLNFYEPTDIERIIERSAAILKVNLNPEATKAIALRSRFTPRMANRILKRVRDIATIEGLDMVDKKTAEDVFTFLEIDSKGLEPDDRKILEAIITKFAGGPVGIQALAAMVAEEQDTILDVYEPYLLQLGLLERTPRGRVATSLAYEHLGMRQPNNSLL
jgi:Holliday junction DNA helicase RuvB